MYYKLAVIGNPIQHSLSPVIFNLFAKEFKLNIEYSRILALDTNDFKIKVEEFFLNGGLALNITSPFKDSAYRIANSKTVRSNFCKASNFIRLIDNQLLADTTDGIGLVKDIKSNKEYSLTDKKILIIGSGYVLDSILLDIIVENPSQIDILARNEARINYLCEKYSVSSFNLNAKYDVVFNTTPNEPGNQLFSQVKLIKDGGLCYDLTYNKTSLFLEQMKKVNPQISGYNGLGMLVMQAQVAFTKLFNHIPNTRNVLNQLAQLGL